VQENKRYLFFWAYDVLCRTNTDEGGIVCRMCIEEDTVGEESYLKQDEVCG